MKKVFSYVVTIACVFFVSSSYTQNTIAKNILYSKGEKNIEFIEGFKIVRGERPPIDINSIPDGAYEEGMLFIKVKPTLRLFLPEKNVVIKRGEYLNTGFSDFDSLCKQYGLKQIEPLLNELYEVSQKMCDNDAKHKAWGFDLWFKVTINENADIRQAVHDFYGLESIEIAEPIYRKRLIEPVESLPVASVKSSRFTPNDPMYASNQWHFNNTGQVISGTAGIAGIDIKTQEAWDIEKGNSNVVVSVHDGGIQFNHPDLSGNMWNGIGPEGTNTKPNSHGTHVAGTVAALTNNSIGVAGIAGGSGTGDGVRLMSLDIFEGTLSTYNGFVYAANNGAAISQNSWGYQNPNVYNTPDLNGIDYFNANGGGEALEGGGIVIFAAGNSNSNANWYPAFYSGTLAVASHTNRGTRSSFSNYGSWVDISAPGSAVTSTDVNGSYSSKSGTSMACPHVSGVAALVASYAYGALTPDQLWEILVENVDDIYEYNPSFTGQLGLGRLNAFKALEAAQVYLGGVNKPSSFSSTLLGTSTIELNWTKNNEGNDVMILWSLSPSFGNLIQGQSYNVGQEVEGGGIVLYKGSANQFIHSNLLDNTTYYYRAYSYTSSNEYSPGIRTNSTTAWGVRPVLFEGFEPPDATNEGKMPLGWKAMRNTAGLGGLNGGGLFNVTDGWWQVSQKKPFFDGSYLQYIRTGEAAIAVPLGALHFNWAISPVIHLPSNCESISLSFWMWYASTGANGNRPSNFYFQIFVDNQWKLLRSWVGEENNTYNSAIEFDISEHQGKAIKLAFIMEYSYGYPIAIDDISITAVSKDAEIISFSFNEQFDFATITSDDGSGNGIVDMVVILGSNLENLTPYIIASPGATTSPPNAQANDFSNPVNYSVTAHDGVTTKNWVINVSEASNLSDKADILSFDVDLDYDMILIFPDDGSGVGRVKVAVPQGTSVGELSPTISISAGASLSPESGIPQNFSQPVNYTVTAQDSVATKEWIATVAVSSSEAEILAFELNEQIASATIVPDDGWGTGNISIEVRPGTNLAALTPIITLSEGASVYPPSNMTVDFTQTVHYVVKAQNGINTKNWYITVNIGANDPMNLFENLKIYPNPFIDRIHISCPKGISKVLICNILGQVVGVHEINSSETSISTLGLKSGVYFMVFYSANGEKKVVRVVKG